MPYKNPEDEKACRLRNRHKKLAYMKRYRAENLERERERAKLWQESNPDRFKASLEAYSKAHPEVNREASRRYRQRNAERLRVLGRERARLRRETDREGNNERARTYTKQRRERDINFRLREVLRARLGTAIRAAKAKKRNRTSELIGCDIEFLKGYLEARFTVGMTWANYGEWVIDHHVPCAEFDLRDPEQQKQCFHYSNLRPLWWSDNAKKAAKRPEVITQ